MAYLLLLLICKNSLYILDVNPRQVCNLQVFSPFRRLSFHSVYVCFLLLPVIHFSKKNFVLNWKEPGRSEKAACGGLRRPLR